MANYMEDRLLAGMIPLTINDRETVMNARKNFLTFVQSPVEFTDETNAFIYSVLKQYYRAFESFPDKDIFSQTLTDNQIDPQKVTESVLKFTSLSKTLVPPDKFIFYHEKALENRGRRSLSESLEKALDLLHGPAEIEQDGQQVSSLSAAKDLIIPSLFETGGSQGSFLAGKTPAGNILEEREQLLAEYEEAELTHGVVDGIYTGFKKIDESIDAMQKGQLILLAGASGEGKSWMAANIAHNAAVMQKKNVVVITAETLREQYRRRIVVRHSNMPQFPYPVDSKRLKTGRLSPEEKENYINVVNDFTQPGKYGSLEVTQVSNSTTVSDIRFYLERLQLFRPIDLVIIDYLSLLKPTRHRQSQREEAVELLKEAKQLAITFNKGAGIPILTLWQISFQARDKVQWAPGKGYTLSSLADSSEAGKSADIAYSILRTDDMKPNNEIGVQILKTRDSIPENEMFKLFEHFQYGLITDLEE